MARAGGGGQLAVKQHAVLLPGIFYSLFPCFLFKSNPRCQLHPRCAPRRHWEPLGCWPRISCFQKGFFWQLWGGMALGWPQSLQEGRTDGRTPRGGCGTVGVPMVCVRCGRAAKLRGTCRDAARGGIHPPVCKITCAVRGVEPGLLCLLSAAC